MLTHNTHTHSTCALTQHMLTHSTCAHAAHSHVPIQGTAHSTRTHAARVAHTSHTRSTFT